MDALTALRSIGGYTPANSTSARNAATAAEWEFHNFILGVKEQVIAQYGKSSDELQALGLKKKSEYKAPGARKKASA